MNNSLKNLSANLINNKNIHRHPKCKGYQSNNYFEPDEYECGYMSKLSCDECIYNIIRGRKNPEAKCNQ
ncbi:hypothetical protein M0Q50_10780 [bacterium]|jgi:hypothetical protein|nr:hypothetical protein [bacterium]